MRRRFIHLGFAVVALLCGGIAVYQAARLHQIIALNLAIASASTAQSDPLNDNSQPPPVALARALATARAGNLDHAVKGLSQLSERTPADPATRAALYDLGNLYLRRGIALGTDSPVAAVPLLELAKQRYRDLLRLDPQQWDARYNLERALRLAPEAQTAFTEQGRRGETRASMAPRDDVVVPDLP
jgi:mxaK protein